MAREYEMSLNHLLRIEATNRAMLLKSSGLSMRSCHPEPRGDFPVHQLGLQHLGHSSILKRGHIPLPGLLSMGYLPMFLAKNIQKDLETSKKQLKFKTTMFVGLNPHVLLVQLYIFQGSPRTTRARYTAAAAQSRTMEPST